MSLIHLEKSVLTFHLKEILEDGHGGHPLTWLGLGLLILAPKLIPAAKNPQPGQKLLLGTKRSEQAPMPLSQWIAEAQQRELTHQYNAAIENQTQNGYQRSDSILMN